VLDLFSSVLNQEIGWEECLQNDLFCVACHIRRAGSTWLKWETEILLLT